MPMLVGLVWANTSDVETQKMIEVLQAVVKAGCRFDQTDYL
jgi:hypothetical protein